MKYVQMYFSYLEPLADLTDEQLGRVTRAILRYGKDKVLPSFTGPEALAFKFMKSNFDREEASYGDIFEKRSAAGKKGGAPKGNRNAAKNKQNKQNKQTSYEEEEEEEEEDEEEESSKEVVFDDDDDDRLRHVMDMYRTEIGPPSLAVSRSLEESARRWGPQLVERVLQECVKNGAHSWAYIHKALEGCEREGLTTVEAYDRAHRFGRPGKVVDRAEHSGHDILGKPKAIRLKRED